MQADLLVPLGRVLREAREKADRKQIHIATRAGVSENVVSRLERGERWPEIGPDRLVAAYAVECEVGWLELWERATAAARPK